MTTGHDTLIDLLAADFARAAGELEHARLVAALKDSTAHRAAVSDCEGAVDAVLDLFLLVRQPPAPRRRGRPSPAVAPGGLTAVISAVT
jgi:hypothetical protein